MDAHGRVTRVCGGVYVLGTRPRDNGKKNLIRTGWATLLDIEIFFFLSLCACLLCTCTNLQVLYTYVSFVSVSFVFFSSLLFFFRKRCEPCLQASPEVSQLAEDFSSDDVIIIGVNNESIFGVTKPPKMDVLLPFLEEHEEDFQYTIVVDNAEGFAKDSTLI